MEILTPHERDIGALNFRVLRLLPSAANQMVGPFIFFDHFGPVTMPPGEGMDVRPHPHIGLATVTYLFEGGILHRDSAGSVQPIRPGDVNWMSAGRGIVHSERTPPALREAGHRLHGIQTWLALPAAKEQSAPAFSHHPADSLPVLDENGVSLRLIAGTHQGLRAPAPVFSPTLYAALEFEAGATFTLTPEHQQRAVYLVQGEADIDGTPLAPQHMAVLEPGTSVQICSDTGARVMLAGGAELEGRRFIWWNFVASSKELIEDAKLRWSERRFDAVPGENGFIPLP